MNRATPNINTARLTLRAMRPEDFDRYAEIWAQPEVVRFSGGRPLSRGEAWNAFLRNAGHWQMTGFGQWAIAEQRTRRMVGHTGFCFSAQGYGADFDPFPAAGWVLAPEAQSKGYGVEATSAAHDWFDRIMPGKLVTSVHAEDIGSLRLAAKLGYEEMQEITHGDDSVVLLRRTGPPAAL
ncbi:GNAT family N-acetyltransferase [Sedimentitalea arenosa]|uniref:GNAT family N-acetyltransferase n=1 Tax=Sedimentitalea arenosa TaxID=2798803 RepID=A0A8J7J9Y7_9RHOB|nr:GNAT family N-acetyltransferase [Arenibacterium arenosum]MBJ6373597.1 GNAT family N-acetyltransferase [Arenibacterium arenosum]